MLSTVPVSKVMCLDIVDHVVYVRKLWQGVRTQVPLQKMPLIDKPFKRIVIDLVGPFSPFSGDGHRYILTLVDFATRYPEAVPLTNIDSETIAEALVNIFCRLWVPEEILSDLGTKPSSMKLHEGGDPHA